MVAINSSMIGIQDQYKKEQSPILFKPYDDQKAELGKGWHYYAETPEGKSFVYPASIYSLEEYSKMNKNYKVLYFDWDQMDSWINEDMGRLQKEADPNRPIESIAEILREFPKPPWDLMEIREIKNGELINIYQIVYACGEGQTNDKGESMWDSIVVRRFQYKEYVGKEDKDVFLELSHQTTVASTENGWAIGMPECYNKICIGWNAAHGAKDMLRAMEYKDGMPKRILNEIMAEAICDTFRYFRVCNYVHSLAPKEYDPESVIHRTLENINNKDFIRQQKELSKRVVRVLRAGTTKTVGTGQGTKHSHRYGVAGHWRRANGKVTFVKQHERGVEHEEYQEVQYAHTPIEQKAVVKHSFYDRTKVLFMERKWTTSLKKVLISFIRRFKTFVPLHEKKPL